MGHELRDLARAYADGEITDLQIQQLESILQNSDGARQQYLQELNLISVLEDLSMTVGSPPTNAVPDTTHAGKFRRIAVWVSGIAAALLLAAFLVTHSDWPSQSAMAAVQRSYNVAALPTTRRYLLQVEHRLQSDRTRTTDVDLYVRGSDRFVLRHPGPLAGTSIWLGRDGAESWIVPPLGPVLKGDHTLHDRWVQDGFDAPRLHISELLTRMMSRGYRLETLSDARVSTPDGLAVQCQHIRARCTTPDEPDVPATIELWASQDSGMAIRLIAWWPLREGETGKESVVLSFQGEESSLSDAWFTAEAHLSGDR